MEKTKAIALASKFARQKGYDTRQYDVTAEKIDTGWEIHFQKSAIHKPRPGDFFTVYIDRKSKSVSRLIKGK